MPRVSSSTHKKQEFSESELLLDKEFDEEALLEQPDNILFLLTDDPQHFILN